jgi:aspartate racemase
MGYRHSRSGVPLELTIVHADVRELARNVTALARQTQAEIFAGLVRRLAGAGAQLAAVTSMGGHFCIGELEPLSPLPLLNAIPEVEAAIRERGLTTIGILGTKLVMETGLYGGISSATIVAPEGDALERVHRSYIEMAQAGRVTEDQRQTFFAAGNGCIGS